MFIEVFVLLGRVLVILFDTAESDDPKLNREGSVEDSQFPNCTSRFPIW